MSETRNTLSHLRAEILFLGDQPADLVFWANDSIKFARFDAVFFQAVDNRRRQGDVPRSHLGFHHLIDIPEYT